MASHNWGQRPRIPQRVKNQVRRRDRVCQLQYPGCTIGATNAEAQQARVPATTPHRPPAILRQVRLRSTPRTSTSQRPGHLSQLCGVGDATPSRPAGTMNSRRHPPTPRRRRPRRRAIPDPRASQQHYYQPANTSGTVATGRGGVGCPWLPPTPARDAIAADQLRAVCQRL